MFKKYTKILTVEGLHCEHCAKKVETALKTIPGIKKVSVNLETKEVTILSNKELTNSSIESVFKDLDYDLINIK